MQPRGPETEREQRAVRLLRAGVVTRRLETQRVVPDAGVAIDAAQVDRGDLTPTESRRDPAGRERDAGLRRRSRDTPDCGRDAQGLGEERERVTLGIGADLAPLRRARVRRLRRSTTTRPRWSRCRRGRGRARACGAGSA